MYLGIIQLCNLVLYMYIKFNDEKNNCKVKRNITQYVALEVICGGLGSHTHQLYSR
jgi:hypothetical protein